MSSIDARAYQAAVRAFAETARWNAPHAVTLTMKQGLPIDGGRGTSIQMLTADEASKNLRLFLNRLNQHVFGNSAQRHGKRVPVISVIEGGNGKRLHYHLAIDCPRDDLKAGYVDLLSAFWQETPWGYKKVHIVADSDKGWTKYITKLRDKDHYPDSIDWVNCHLSDRRD